MYEEQKKTYRRLKAKYQDAIVVIHSGDKYITFDVDAHNANKVITPFNLVNDRFEFSSFDDVVPKLIKAGYKVALVDELIADKQTKKNYGKFKSRHAG